MIWVPRFSSGWPDSSTGNQGRCLCSVISQKTATVTQSPLRNLQVSPWVSSLLPCSNKPNFKCVEFMPKSQDGTVPVNSHRRTGVSTLSRSQRYGHKQMHISSQWTFWADLGRVNRALIRVFYRRFSEFLQERWLSPMTRNLGWLLCCERNKEKWNEYVVLVPYFIIYLQRHRYVQKEK